MPREHAEAIALEALDQWARAFAERDPDAMARLHSERALFFGSRPQLYAGRSGVRSYFASLRPRSSNSVRFSDVAAEALADTVIQLAATAWFTVDHRVPIPMRVSQTLVCEDGQWVVAQHHASPPPAAT
ncbi:SgcJ/EcaC family oxidoreductase [Schlegelella sp. ID0723]|uniref:SgcJ/EcaC family oxidoreductase n=2 Tax=Piscinibacter koreensis TaxID=2742824 RepID=A0A7Y6NMZ4_9BURK|nr:SgcJ/EcaC family oxidoreductase [Schlegelella koreensis]